MWYYIYNKGTKKLISETEVKPLKLKNKLAYVSSDIRLGKTREWSEVNSSLKVKKELFRISYKNILTFFTDDELKVFLDLTKKNWEIMVFYERIRHQKSVALTSLQISSLLTLFVKNNIIKNARKKDFTYG